MLASELIVLLAEHPEYEVLVETETMICPVKLVDTDCFAAGEPWVFVIEADTTKEGP